MNNRMVEGVMAIFHSRLEKANVSIDTLTDDEWELLYLSACKEYIKDYEDNLH